MVDSVGGAFLTQNVSDFLSRYVWLGLGLRVGLQREMNSNQCTI